MLKMPEDMTADELEKFERLMLEADDTIAKRKKEDNWRDEPLKDSIERIISRCTK